MKGWRWARWRVLAVGGLALGLLAGSAWSDGYQAGVTAKVLCKTTVTGNGQPIAYPQTDKAEVTAMTVELAPGASTGWHAHPVPVYAYVVSGTLSVELEDGTSRTFGPDEAVIEVVNTLHNGSNRGAEPVKLAVFYLGVAGMPNVVTPAQPAAVPRQAPK
ncbi:cupin domain-containing protein [Desulfobulbus elongatus]|uniref:cupin domain-containing protein n=1 Tax=Desulfobulbus elongatus TaxID=53332 RepID=UPI000687ACD7|nr:cupin domain-containing protein [Desulfobulbus elongatus]